MLGRGFEHIEQGRDIGVDAAAEILEVDEHYVERLHRLPRWAAHLAIEAEHRHPIGWIGEVGRLHHIVLKVAAHAVLRPEYRGDVDPCGDERVEAVRQDRKSTRLNSSHYCASRMPSSA